MGKDSSSDRAKSQTPAEPAKSTYAVSDATIKNIENLLKKDGINVSVSAGENGSIVINTGIHNVGETGKKETGALMTILHKTYGIEIEDLSRNRKIPLVNNESPIGEATITIEAKDVQRLENKATGKKVAPVEEQQKAPPVGRKPTELLLMPEELKVASAGKEGVQEVTGKPSKGGLRGILNKIGKRAGSAMGSVSQALNSPQSKETSGSIDDRKQASQQMSALDMLQLAEQASSSKITTQKAEETVRNKWQDTIANQRNNGRQSGIYI